MRMKGGVQDAGRPGANRRQHQRPAARDRIGNELNGRGLRHARCLLGRRWLCFGWPRPMTFSQKTKISPAALEKKKTRALRSGTRLACWKAKQVHPQISPIHTKGNQPRPVRVAQTAF